ncbi:hypothetical protein NDU88_000173 [Pleurodeles waltl]|uniref:Uncharacterized protein n=1 Tax=Pleurodeles waltl TaxID=8319 RepID=A0AAV7VXD1_PLEWA|nr:hypothetical protein NDU88_000173 [Pleurodeles waltl]
MGLTPVPDNSVQATVQSNAPTVMGPSLVVTPLGLTPPAGNSGQAAEQNNATLATTAAPTGSKSGDFRNWAFFTAYGLGDIHSENEQLGLHVSIEVKKKIWKGAHVDILDLQVDKSEKEEAKRCPILAQTDGTTLTKYQAMRLRPHNKGDSDCCCTSPMPEAPPVLLGHAKFCTRRPLKGAAWW